MNYSISYKDAAGVTVRSEHLAFASEEAALAHAMKTPPATGLIEVWKDEHLVMRFDTAARGAGS